MQMSGRQAGTGCAQSGSAIVELIPSRRCLLAAGAGGPLGGALLPAFGNSQSAADGINRWAVGVLMLIRRGP